MKKLTSLILLIAILVPLVISCNSSPSSKNDPPTTETPQDPGDETFIINDVLESYYNDIVRIGTNDKITFSSHWDKSANYYTRFLGGEEYWVTDDRVPNGQEATCTVKFFGHSIKIYGHTGPTGGMASISVDGVVQEKTADFYSEERVEALNGKYSGTLEPFFEIEGLENKEHTIVITLLKDQKNPSHIANKLEIAVDYAVATRIAGSNPYAGGALPVIDTAFEGFVGNPYQYSYLSDYAKVCNSFKRPSMTKSASLKLFRSDVTNSKIDIISGSEEITLKASASAFKSKSGKTLPASCVELSFLEYVRDHQTNKKIYDVLGDDTRTFPAKSYGALWVSVTTQKDTPAGTYTGNITISGNDHELTFPYTIEVVDIDISVADKFFTNDLWMYPYSANRYYSGKTVREYFGTDNIRPNKTSLRYVYLEDKYMPQLAEQIKLYAAGGGDVITVTLIEDSWNNQTTDPYPSMVKWTKKSNGTWAFDYTDFDKWVKLNMENGVDSKIKCYSLANWNENLIYLDEATNSAKTMSCKVGTDVWREAWSAFLTDFMAHLKEKGWFEITYLAMDERSTEQIAAVCELVSNFKDENGKIFKMSLATNRVSSRAYFDYFDDLAFSSSQRNVLGNIVTNRAAKGLTTMFYTCGATAGSLKNEPYDTLDFYYFLYQRGCDGYLRWAFDAFPEDPLTDTLHWRFVAGDQNLIYPDSRDEQNPTVRSSVRYQVMMESYKNICALETMKSMSEEGESGVKSLVNSYTAYSGVKLSQTKTMENSIFKLAEKLLAAK